MADLVRARRAVRRRGLLSPPKAAGAPVSSNSPGGEESAHVEGAFPILFWRVSFAALSSRDPGEPGVRCWWLLGDAGENSIPPIYCDPAAAALTSLSLIPYSTFWCCRLATVYSYPFHSLPFPSFPSCSPQSIYNASETRSSSSLLRTIPINSWPTGLPIKDSSSPPNH
jgi:hypothetical protein